MAITKYESYYKQIRESVEEIKIIMIIIIYQKHLYTGT